MTGEGGAPPFRVWAAPGLATPSAAPPTCGRCSCGSLGLSEALPDAAPSVMPFLASEGLGGNSGLPVQRFVLSAYPAEGVLREAGHLPADRWFIYGSYSTVLILAPLPPNLHHFLNVYAGYRWKVGCR